MVSTSGRWIIEPYGIFNGYSGVTTNQSEGFNTLMKQMTMRKEKSADSLSLALYFLQCYFKNEVQRGLAGLGQYTLDKSFQGMSIDAEDMDLEDCYPPAEIVEKMVLVRQQTDRESNIAKMNGNKQIGADEMEGDDIVDENEKDEQNKSTTNNILPSSQMMIVDNNKCIYQPEMKVFTVQGTCDVHAVKLFPKQSCTCPAKSECYHVLSAKLYMGMDLGKKQKKITMSH